MKHDTTNRERGAALLETALTLPLLLLVSVGIFEFGRAYQTWQVLTNAAREGARVAVLPNRRPAPREARVRSYMTRRPAAERGDRDRRRHAHRRSRSAARHATASHVTVNYPFTFIVLQPVARLVVAGSTLGAAAHDDARVRDAKRNAVATVGDLTMARMRSHSCVVRRSRSPPAALRVRRPTTYVQKPPGEDRRDPDQAGGRRRGGSRRRRRADARGHPHHRLAGQRGARRRDLAIRRRSIGRGADHADDPERAVPADEAGVEGAGAGLPPAIPPGLRAVSVRVNEVIGVAGYVLPGTRVDVVATVNPTQQRPT